MHIVLMAIVLYVLIDLLSGVRARDHRGKILVLILAVILLEGVVRFYIQSIVWNWVLALLIAVALALTLILWLRVSKLNALMVVGAFIAIRFAVGFALLWLLRGAV